MTSARIVDLAQAAIRAGAAPADLGRSLARRGAPGGALRQPTNTLTGDRAPRLHIRQRGPPNAQADRGRRHRRSRRGRARRIARSDGPLPCSYLNVPPARIPGEGGEQLADLPADANAIRAALLDAFDRQRQVDLAARLVARHHARPFAAGADRHACARGSARRCRLSCLSDAGQVRQFTVWGNPTKNRHILIAVARYLAAHSPTERAALQTADIARRLMRGGELHQEAAVS